MKTPAQLAQHITELAAAFHVKLAVYEKMAPDRAMAVRYPKANRFTGERFDVNVIRIAPVTDETTYAAALHEIGHLVAPLGMLHAELTPQMRATRVPATARDVVLQLEMENAAWDWAEHYALEWTPLMLSVKRMTLGTYERMARHYLGKGVPR